MSFTHKEPLQPKLTALPASNDIEALVRAEHPDPFSILGPHDDEQGGQFIRAFLPEALSVQVLARDGGEPLGNLDATQVPGLFVGHFTTRQAYLLKIQWAGGEQITSISFRPAAASWPIQRSLVSVAMRPWAICRPSRGPTSHTLTVGVMVKAPAVVTRS